MAAFLQQQQKKRMKRPARKQVAKKQTRRPSDRKPLLPLFGQQPQKKNGGATPMRSLGRFTGFNPNTKKGKRVVTYHYWPGEKGRHSIAAKQGWEKRRRRDDFFKHSPKQWKDIARKAEKSGWEPQYRTHYPGRLDIFKDDKAFYIFKETVNKRGGYNVAYRLKDFDGTKTRNFSTLEEAMDFATSLINFEEIGMGWLYE